jgi:uncharacterized protein
VRNQLSQLAPTRLPRVLPAVALTTAAMLLTAARALSERIEQLQPQGYVSDFAGLLDSPTKTRINALCAEVDERTHAQLAVVTIHSLDGVQIEDFANKLYKHWGLGYKGEDRGALLLFAANDHKYRVEVGYGLEPILPDGKVGTFGREVVPLLREGDYNLGLLKLTAQIAGVVARDRGVALARLPSEESGASSESSNAGWATLIILTLAIAGLGGLGTFLWLAWLVREGRFDVGRGGRVWSVPAGRGVFWVGGSFGGSGGGFGGFGGGSSGGGGASGSW